MVVTHVSFQPAHLQVLWFGRNTGTVSVHSVWFGYGGKKTHAGFGGRVCGLPHGLPHGLPRGLPQPGQRDIFPPARGVSSFFWSSYLVL